MKPLLALLAFALPLASAPLPKPREKPDYYPVAVGNEWVYERKARDVVCEYRTRIVESTSKDGVVTAKEEMNDTDSDRTTKYSVRIDEQGMSKNWLTGSGDETWIRHLPARWAVGDTWTAEGQFNDSVHKFTFKIEAEEEVVVPAGKYKAVKVSKTFDGWTVDIHYARDVGIVRTEATNTKSGLSATAELKSFTPGKAKE